MKRRIKVQEHEKLDDINVNRVVSLLEQSKPITKKAACEILNIRYDTKRLGRIIEEYKDNLIYTEKRMKENKGRIFDNLETQDLVISYLSGESIASISRRFYRTIHIIKKEISKYNLPNKDKTTNYFNPKLMPDEMVSENFEKGEYVWSARYSCVAEIINEFPYKDRKAYAIYIFGKYMQFGCQAVEELGKLDILKQFKLQDGEFQTITQDFNYRIE